MSSNLKLKESKVIKNSPDTYQSLMRFQIQYLSITVDRRAGTPRIVHEQGSLVTRHEEAITDRRPGEAEPHQLTSSHLVLSYI